MLHARAATELKDNRRTRVAAWRPVGSTPATVTEAETQIEPLCLT